MQSRPGATLAQTASVNSILLPCYTACTALLCLAAGCYSTTLMQDPEPLLPGHVRGAIGITSDGPGAGPEVAVRVGIPKDMELRAKLSPSTVEAGLNVRAYDGELLDVFLMPGYSGAIAYEEDTDSFSDEGAYNYERHIQAFVMPAIAKIEVTPTFDVFAGPDVRVGTRDSVGWLGVGGHVGVAIGTAGDRFSFVPECSLLNATLGARPQPADENGAGASKTLARGDWKGQCGLGITFGGRHANQSSKHE